MNEKIPRTPFSTPLSGSAKETEIRLKHIFSGPKKRPPALFLALMFAVCLMCGNLVSCHVKEETPPDVSDPDARVVALADGYYPKNYDEQWLLLALFQEADTQQPFQYPTAGLLASIQGEGCTLGAAFVEDHTENTLLLGVMDQETHELIEPLFRCSYHGGAANIVTYRDYDGKDCLLYTFNGQENGQYSGEAGVVRFDGKYMTWQWPVEGNVSYPSGGVQAVRGAREPYQEYWNDHLALMAPGGVDIYTANPDFVYGADEPVSMWQLEQGETFYSDPGSAAELPMPIYFQSLDWLIGYTADPGGWRITSLELNEERCDPEAQTDCFTLRAREELGDGELTADLFFSYESEPTRPRIYGYLVHAEVREDP